MSERTSTPRGRAEQPTWVGVDPSKDELGRAPLTRPRIVRAALRLVDEQGLPALTMRALATELKVSTMALYNHVRDKDELTDLMLDLMLGEVDCSPAEGDWSTQLRTLACSYHTALSAHTNLVRVYSTQIRLGPHSLMVMERVLGLLLEAGFSSADAADAFFALYTYIVGFHQMGRAAPLPCLTSQEDGTVGYYTALPPEQIPSIVAVSQHLEGAHRSDGFEYGLDVFLGGLQAQVHER
ncbi:MAG: TetR/AcrR family transcriptional regulator [Pseudonocardia sp.]